MRRELDGLAPKLAEGAWVADSAQVIGNVVMEQNASVWFGAVLRGDNETLHIGRDSNVQDLSVIHTDPGQPVTIGAGCTVGHRVILHSTTVEDGSLIGMGSTLLNRSRIGKNCLVGANSLVTEGKQFPELVQFYHGEVLQFAQQLLGGVLARGLESGEFRDCPAMAEPRVVFGAWDEKAGAAVTHVDASKKAVGFARENQAAAGLTDKPIRWIVDDAMKFTAREERRGSRYDGIVLDPPKYGRGPNGEVWDLFRDLPRMLELCRAVLAEEPAFVILTAYAILLALPIWALLHGRITHYEPLPWQTPKLDWFGIAIFGQMTVGALSGFEYVAILAGECRSAARTIGQSLSKIWGQQPVIENRPGAGGIVASQALTQSTPDGYTLILVASGHPLNQFIYPKVPYDTFKDFTAISEIAYSPLAIVVSRSSPLKNLGELR